MTKASSCTAGGLTITHDYYPTPPSTDNRPFTTSAATAASSIGGFVIIGPTSQSLVEFTHLYFGTVAIRDIKIVPKDTCFVETGIPPDQYLDEETFDIDSGVFNIYFPTKIACPNNIVLSVDHLTFVDGGSNDLLAEGWVTYSGSTVIINTNHHSLY